MGKNIALLYMSAYFAQPAPEGSKNRFLRTQTNEAAVSALWKDPASRPDKIVALCSDTVRTKPTVPAADGSGNKVPTLEYFRDEFLKQLGVQPEQLVAVSVPDSMEEADQTRAISAVLEQVAENDNLYIDLSGGMRDTATLLLIVARYLKDIRMVQTKKVLYSELKGNSSVVRDSTGLYNLMDLITAVDAFFSTGTTEKLKAYMKQTGETDPDILNLLDRIDHFADDLALCRVQMLKADLKAIARQIKQRPASRETLSSLLYELMNDRFEAEFQNLMGSRSDSLPALVQWCAHHRMYQQGLTLLSEEMPTYLCGHLFLQPTGKALDYMALQPQNKGKSWVFPMFHYHFCRAALFHEARPFTVNLCLTKDKTEANGNALFRVATLTEAQEYLTAAVEQGELLLDLTWKDTVAQGIVYYQSVQQYRNQINHATDSAVKFQKDTGLLPLSTSAIEQTLGDVAFYLARLKDCKANAPAGIELLDSNKAF